MMNQRCLLTNFLFIVIASTVVLTAGEQASAFNVLRFSGMSPTTQSIHSRKSIRISEVYTMFFVLAKVTSAAVLVAGEYVQTIVCMPQVRAEQL